MKGTLLGLPVVVLRGCWERGFRRPLGSSQGAQLETRSFPKNMLPPAERVNGKGACGVQGAQWLRVGPSSLLPSLSLPPLSSLPLPAPLQLCANSLRKIRIFLNSRRAPKLCPLGCLFAKEHGGLARTPAGPHPVDLGFLPVEWTRSDVPSLHSCCGASLSDAPAPTRACPL